jgi:hypothetical protein
LITNLQTIKDLYGDKIITTNDYDSFVKTCKMKDIDYDIFEAAHKLFNEFINLTQKLITGLFIGHFLTNQQQR